MKLGTLLQYSGDIVASANQVAEWEKAGLDQCWVAEAYGDDSATLLGYLAAKTEKVELATGILNVFSRTPALIAQTAAGLDRVSNGRAILGLGASGPQVIEGWHGMPYAKPLTRTREVIEVSRRIWTREVMEHHGVFDMPLPEGQGTGLGKPLKLITHPIRQHIPIWVAGLGPKSVAMTAELADGWMPHLFLPEGVNEIWGESLAAGKAKRSADLAPLETIAGGAFCITEDETVAQHVLDFTKHMVALYVGGMGARGKNFYNDLFASYGYEAEAKQIQDLYLDGKKNEAAMAIPDEFMRNTNFVGSPGFIKERIQAFREVGVNVLNIVPVGENPTQMIADLKAWVS